MLYTQMYSTYSRHVPLTCGWSERLTDGETKNIDTQMQGVGDLKKKILSNTDNDAVTAAADLDNFK